VLKTAEDLVISIRDDRRQGASQLAIQSLEGLITLAGALKVENEKTFRRELYAHIAELEDIRPSMVAIGNAIRTWRHRFESIPLNSHHRTTPQAQSEHLVKAVENMTLGLITEIRQAVVECASQMAALIEPGDCLMTHSLSSSIKHFFSLLPAGEVSAIITESRPLNEGYLLAEFLSSRHIDTVLITDAQMGVWCSSATKIITGADAVLGDGSVVNKSGTLLLALAAQEFHVPFYVCCDSYKYTDQASDDFHLEEMQALELGFDTIKHVDTRNIYFDITPARLITGWVSESGLKRDW